MALPPPGDSITWRMWQQYRTTFVLTQLFIFGACAAAKVFGGMPWFTVVMLFLLMQVGSLLGAWWAARLTRRMQRERDRLPLERVDRRP